MLSVGFRLRARSDPAGLFRWVLLAVTRRIPALPVPLQLWKRTDRQDATSLARAQRPSERWRVPARLSFRALPSPKLSRDHSALPTRIGYTPRNPHLTRQRHPGCLHLNWANPPNPDPANSWVRRPSGTLGSADALIMYHISLHLNVAYRYGAPDKARGLHPLPAVPIRGGQISHPIWLSGNPTPGMRYHLPGDCLLPHVSSPKLCPYSPPVTASVLLGFHRRIHTCSV